MATLVQSAGKYDEPKHLLEFLRTGQMIMLTPGLLGLYLLCSPQLDIYCMWANLRHSLLQHNNPYDLGVVGPPSVFPPQQNCAFKDILIFPEESASLNPKCQFSPQLPRELIPQATVFASRKHFKAKTVACLQNLSYHHASGSRGSSPNLQCLGPQGTSSLQQPSWLLLMGMPQSCKPRWC